VTAITYRKPVRPLEEAFIRSANGIFLRLPVETLRGRRDGAPEQNAKDRKLLREVIAFSRAKKK
jgi:hypothetical protein